MSFLLMLVLFTAILFVPPLSRQDGLRRLPDKMAAAMGLGFLVTGSMHFSNPGRFVAMMPPAIPAHLPLVYASGALELLGGIGMLIPRTRRPAAWGLALLLIAVFPANVHVALTGAAVEGLPQAGWYYWVRLPFQAVFIAWALWSTRAPGP